MKSIHPYPIVVFILKNNGFINKFCSFYVIIKEGNF